MIAGVLSEEIFVVIIFSNKKNNLFSTHLSIEHKNALFHSLETVLMKEEEKKLPYYFYVDRKETTKKVVM